MGLLHESISWQCISDLPVLFKLNLTNLAKYLFLLNFLEHIYYTIFSKFINYLIFYFFSKRGNITFMFNSRSNKELTIECLSLYFIVTFKDLKISTGPFSFQIFQVFHSYSSFTCIQFTIIYFYSCTFWKH